MPAAKPKTLGEALLRVQQSVSKVAKDSQNPHFRSAYAGLPGVMDAILPELQKSNVLLLQPLTNLDGSPAIETSLTLLDTGENITRVTPLTLAKQDPQGVGSAVTYMRRYSLLSTLGIVTDDDDDGNAASFKQAVADKATVDAPFEQAVPVAASGSPFGGGIG